MNAPVNMLMVSVHTQDAMFHVGWATVVYGAVGTTCPSCDMVSGGVVQVGGQHQGTDVSLDDLRRIWIEWSADLYALQLGALDIGQQMEVGNVWSTVMFDSRADTPQIGWWIRAAGAAFLVDAGELSQVCDTLELMITKATRHGFASFDAQNERADLPQNLRDELAHLDLESL